MWSCWQWDLNPTTISVVVVTVYIRPRAVQDATCDIISLTVFRLQTKHPDALFIESGTRLEFFFCPSSSSYLWEVKLL